MNKIGHKGQIILAFILLLTVFHNGANAQTTTGLVAYYPFDGDLKDATGNTGNQASSFGVIDYGCGVEGDALILLGGASYAHVEGMNNINQEFDTEDFTLSFYFKPTGITGQQYLISKRDTACVNNVGQNFHEKDFFIKYVPASRTVNVQLVEIQAKILSISTIIQNTACWQHLTLVRNDNRLKLYINGEYAGEDANATRTDITNAGFLTIGDAICKGTNETPFSGYIDELRIYDRALDKREVLELYARPDQIINADTLLFIGGHIDIELTNTCASSFIWSPNSLDLSSASDPTPTITPTTPGSVVYTLSLADGATGCVATDSIKLNIVDPATLECEVAFLPKAFTPNGDGLNDTYGISNPFALQELVSFEIFDRWGNQIFYTNNVFDKWDGTYNGQPLNPGVVMYKVIHVCNKVEYVESGTVTILR